MLTYGACRRVGVALAVGFALASCGGSSSRPALSKMQFTSRANAACAAADARVEGFQAPSDLASLATFAAQVVPVAEDLKRKLSALVPPSPQQAEYRKMLDLLGQQITKYSDFRRAAEAGDEQRAETIGNDVNALSERFNSDAIDLGLPECARNAQPQG